MQTRDRRIAVVIVELYGHKQRTVQGFPLQHRASQKIKKSMAV